MNFKVTTPECLDFIKMHMNLIPVITHAETMLDEAFEGEYVLIAHLERNLTMYIHYNHENIDAADDKIAELNTWLTEQDIFGAMQFALWTPEIAQAIESQTVQAEPEHPHN